VQLPDDLRLTSGRRVRVTAGYQAAAPAALCPRKRRCRQAQ